MFCESNAVSIIFIYGVVYFYLTSGIKKLSKGIVRNYGV